MINIEKIIGIKVTLYTQDGKFTTKIKVKATGIKIPQFTYLR